MRESKNIQFCVTSFLNGPLPKHVLSFGTGTLNLIWVVSTIVNSVTFWWHWNATIVGTFEMISLAFTKSTVPLILIGIICNGTFYSYEHRQDLNNKHLNTRLLWFLGFLWPVFRWTCHQKILCECYILLFALTYLNDVLVYSWWHLA